MSNFFGFQGGTSNSTQGNNKNKSSFMDKLTSAVSQIGQSVGVSSNYSKMSADELHVNGYKALENNQYDRALAMFTEGATRYDLNCILQLSNMYRNGIGVAEDPFQAWFWGRMCAELGSPLGYFLSGLDYSYGMGVDENELKGFAYLEKAVRLGYDDANEHLKKIIDDHLEWYDNGGGYSIERIRNGIESNKDNPEEYYDYCLRLASFDNDDDGKNWVGICSYNGEGVEQDYIAAYYWFKKAAEYGNVFAYYNLANMYATGTGVLLDYEEAIRLYNIAASKGHTMAANRAQTLQHRLNMHIDALYNDFNNHMGYEINCNRSFVVLNHINRFGAERNDVVLSAEYASLSLWGTISIDADYNEALFYAAKAVLGLKNVYNNTSGIGFSYYMLSHIFATGKSVPVDNEKASYFFNLARSQDQEYSAYNDVYQYMSAKLNEMASKNDYYKACSYELGEYGDKNHTEAFNIFDTMASQNYLPAVFKAMRYHQKDTVVSYDDAAMDRYWKIVSYIIDNSQKKQSDWAYIVSEAAGMILDEYNKLENAMYDYLTGQMAADISKKLYRSGKRSLAYIGLVMARERGYSNTENIWNELEAERNANEQAKQQKEEPSAGIIIDDSAIFGYSDHSDWTPYETINTLIKDLDITETHPLENKLCMTPITENGPFDEEIKQIREMEASGAFDKLVELGDMYDEAAYADDISIEELDKNLRLMILCYKIAAAHGNPVALCMIAEAFRNGRGLPVDSQIAVKIYEQLGNFISENVLDNFDEVYDAAKSGVSSEAGEYTQFTERYVNYYDRYAYYLEQSHYPEERWLIHEYYRRAHEKKNREQIAPILFYRNLYTGCRVDWEQVLSMPWTHIVSGKYDQNDTNQIEVSALQESEQEGMPENLDKYFAGMIGMEPVKVQLEKIYQAVKMQLLRNKILEEQGEEVVDSGKGYNFILLGNPGTGKTTVARIIAQVLYDINIRQSNSFVEIERSGVVSDHVGGTEKRMRKILDKVDGGTLFIDEAYALYKEDSDNDFGREAIDVLMKDMEDKRNSYSVIMAGYREPMLNMIKNANTGFSSRFTYTIELPDYTDDSLIEIAHMHIDKQKFTTDDKVDGAIKKCIAHDKIDNTFGNARYIRELVNRAIENQSHRLTNQGSYEIDELFLLKAEDFWQGEYEEDGVEKFLNELNSLIGLESVKQEVESLINFITVGQEMERRGMEHSMDFGTLHMAFKGNPGTGKTTVARIIGKLYASLGVLKRGDVFVECTRSDLVGKYQGHTASNVKKVVDSAMGGILFIDEAYSLCQNDNDSFGREAVDALVAEIENNRKNFVVIFAGYTKDIDEFFKNNSGLRSRVPKDLIFEDYNIDDLYKIAISMINSKKLILAEGAEDTLRNCLMENYNKEDFGNARGVRNIIDAINRRQNVRIAQLLKSNPSEITDEILITIEAEDIVNIAI